MKNKNPQPCTAKGTHIEKVDLTHRNSIGVNCTKNCVFSQAQTFFTIYSDQRLTDAIDFLEKCGYYGDTALFMLAYVGGAINE